ncbi:MAG: chloride channel protein, partial [Caulobacteraceae bacterium]
MAARLGIRPMVGVGTAPTRTARARASPGPGGPMTDRKTLPKARSAAKRNATLRNRKERDPSRSLDAVVENAALAELGDFSTSHRVLVIMGIAALVAVVTSVVGVLMFRLIELITNLCYFGRFSFDYIPFSQSKLGWFAVLVPIAGSIVVGFMARYGSDKIRGHGIPEAIEAILLGRSRLDAKVAVLKPASAVIVIGTGGPFGAEGPIIMTGGAIGSLIAQLLPVSDTERKILLVAGGAAGMTVVFGTPIAAMMLAIELLLFEWTPRSFLPVAVACVVAAVLRHFSGLEYPLFPFVGDVSITLDGVGGWILVGVCGGLLSIVFTRMVYLTEDWFRRLPVHWMWWPALGAIVVGVGGLIDPRALGLGYANIAQLLQGSFTPEAGAKLLVVKALIWAAALGSGTSGGTLAPLMMMGGAMAAAAAEFLPHAAPGFWPMLAMAAVLGGTLRLPLTAILFTVGVTGNTHV